MPVLAILLLLVLFALLISHATKPGGLVHRADPRENARIRAQQVRLMQEITDKRPFDLTHR